MVNFLKKYKFDLIILFYIQCVQSLLIFYENKYNKMIEIMRGGRDYLGEGLIDVASILNAMPIVPYSIELPNSKRVEEYGYEGHAKKCLETAKKYCDTFVTGR